MVKKKESQIESKMTKIQIPSQPLMMHETWSAPFCLHFPICHADTSRLPLRDLVDKAGEGALKTEPWGIPLSQVVGALCSRFPHGL